MKYLSHRFVEVGGHQYMVFNDPADAQNISVSTGCDLYSVEGPQNAIRASDYRVITRV